MRFVVCVALLTCVACSRTESDSGSRPVRTDTPAGIFAVNPAPELADALRRVVTAQDDERRRIARDLHDHLGQQLTALRVRLERLHDRTGDVARDDAAQALERVGARDAEVDFLTWQIRPPMLDELGLAVALPRYVLEDDGVGFDAADPHVREKGIGLVGFHERAALIDARLQVESSPGAGTTIILRANRQKARP